MTLLLLILCLSFFLLLPIIPLIWLFKKITKIGSTESMYTDPKDYEFFILFDRFRLHIGSTIIITGISFALNLVLFITAGAESSTYTKEFLRLYTSINPVTEPVLISLLLFVIFCYFVKFFRWAPKENKRILLVVHILAAVDYIACWTIMIDYPKVSYKEAVKNHLKVYKH